MLHGDLSNEPAAKVGFRFEEIIRREDDGKLNRTGKAFVENIAHLDIDIIILTTGNERRAQAFLYKWGVPFSHVIPVETLLDLENVCRELGMVVYYDTDRELLQRIKSRNYSKMELNLWTLDNNYYVE